MPLIADIKTLLNGIESNIFLGDIPDKPNSLIAIYNSGGSNPEHTMDGIKIKNSTFQIRVRDSSYVSGIARCEEIQDALDMVNNQNVNGHFYLGIFQQGDILSLGRDKENRVEFSLNFNVKK